MKHGTKKRLFNIGTDQPIPSTYKGRDSEGDMHYVISFRDRGGYLQFRFLKKPKGYGGTTPDQPLDVRIPGPCRIILELDPKKKWNFVPKNTSGKYAVMLAGKTTQVSASKKRYGKLEYINSKMVSFLADYLPPPGSLNRDPINIYVLLDQPDASAKPLLIIIDPDIKNPGDPQSVPPGLKVR